MCRILNERKTDRIFRACLAVLSTPNPLLIGATYARPFYETAGTAFSQVSTLEGIIGPLSIAWFHMQVFGGAGIAVLRNNWSRKTVDAGEGNIESDNVKEGIGGDENDENDNVEGVDVGLMAF